VCVHDGRTHGIESCVVLEGRERYKWSVVIEGGDFRFFVQPVAEWATHSAKKANYHDVSRRERDGDRIATNSSA
jgi:hypothetical protein